MREVIEVKEKQTEKDLKKKVEELEETLLNTQLAVTEVVEMVIA